MERGVYSSKEIPQKEISSVGSRGGGKQWLCPGCVTKGGAVAPPKRWSVQSLFNETVREGHWRQST